MGGYTVAKMDFQNRVGHKMGTGGPATDQEVAMDRRARLRELALETVDLNNDPYFMRNHLGSYECKLCLTLHMNEGSYLAHTQGKRHQQNLKRRAWRLGKETPSQPIMSRKKIRPRQTLKIGTPGYKVVKQQDPETNQLILLFRIDYPEIEIELQPRHRFMSSFEQTVEPNRDRNYQYLLFAAEPYETVAFKIPNKPIDKDPNRFLSHWDSKKNTFTLQLWFKNNESVNPSKNHQDSLNFDRY